jgi:hypothetical protein
MSGYNEELIWNAERPWTKEQIMVSTFQNLIATLRTIDSLPGGIIASELEAVHLSLNIFLDATYDLLSSINSFKGESERPDFWNRTRRSNFESLELHIQRGVFSATMAAMALVDHSRIFADKYPVELYHEKVKECFSEDTLHRFVQKFRNFMTHVRITKSNWVVKHDKQGKSVFFFLTQENLNKWDKWDSPSKSYIALNPEGVNVEQLFDDYSGKVKLFHDWFRSQVWQKYSNDLREYFDCKRMYNAINDRSTWNLLIKQVFLLKKIDPYMYLDRYLSNNEIEEILSLPFRSKRQVDLIIELVDEYGACDEEIRKAAYELFGINS